MKKIMILGIALLLLLSFSVAASCVDGIDNDRDGYIDLNDAGCLNERDASEREYGLQLYIAEGIDDVCFESLVVDYGEQCVVDNLYSMTWLLTYYRPLPSLQGCLEDNSYYGLVYDSSVWYSNLALADCVYENIDTYATDLETVWALDTVGGNATKIKEYCLEAYYDSYSGFCVETCSDEECSPYLCDTVSGTCFEECSDDSTCLESAACVTAGPDNFGECYSCVDNDGNDIFTVGEEFFGVNEVGMFAAGRDRCSTDENLREYYCEEIDGHLYLGYDTVTCSEYGSAGCVDGACEELLSEGEICSEDIQCLTGICDDILGVCTTCETLVSYFDCHAESACAWTGTCVSLEGLTCPDLATAGECSSKIEECNWDTSVGGCVETLEPDCTTWEDCVEGVSSCSNSGFCLTCEDNDGNDEYTAGIYSGVDQITGDEISGTEACLSETSVEEYECNSDSTLTLVEVECPSDHVCSEGACVEQVCTTSAECGTGTYCETGSGQCVECLRNNQCVLGAEFCDISSWTCESLLVYGESCAEDTQCDSRICENDICIDCTQDTDCESGFICDKGVGACIDATSSNNAPVINDVSGTLAVIAPGTIRLDVEATDVDGDVLTYTFVNSDLGIDETSSSNSYSWDATVSHVGSYEILITVSDDYETVTWTQEISVIEDPTSSSACTIDTDCTDASLPYCLTSSGECVECFAKVHCGAGNCNPVTHTCGGLMGAPEEEREPGVFLKLWDWLTFWS